jgi:predicted GNAT family N-acyltransferase
MNTELKIELLQSSTHDRSNFDCGYEQLNHFIHHQASQEQKRMVSTTYVLVKDKLVIGFYTLSATSIVANGLSKDISEKLPRYPILPATLLGRLAIATTSQNAGLGKILLFDALQRSYYNAQKIGSVAVIVEAKNNQVQKFYTNLGFNILSSNTLTMYYPMNKIKKLVTSSQTIE